MRIISKFKDYYDKVQSFGQDDLVYIRTESKKDIEIPYHSFESSRGYIGFAGKLYPFVRGNYLFNTSSLIKQKQKYYYNIEDLDKYVNLHDKDIINIYYGMKGRRYIYYQRNTRKELDLFFQMKTTDGRIYQPKYLLDLFSMEVPIFVTSWNGHYNVTATLNCNLHKYEFYRVLDPYTAYQTLFSWLASQARPLKPIPVIDDVTMAEAKGFDRYSFRKPKTK